jgi:hypothetical protein
MFQALCGIQLVRQCCRLLVTFLVSIALAHGQKYDVTALVGGTFAGTVQLEQLGVPNFPARVEDSISYGVSGGFRFDSELNNCRACDLIEFRWLRQDTHLELKQNPLVPAPATAPYFHPAVTLDHFLGDFTHEMTIDESSIVKPFVTASLGAVLVTTPEASAARFVFGIGTGFKVFPRRRWGIRFQVEYLPIVMHTEFQRVICTTGCVFLLNGGITNQFVLSVGPTFRFQ